MHRNRPTNTRSPTRPRRTQPDSRNLVDTPSHQKSVQAIAETAREHIGEAQGIFPDLTRRDLALLTSLLCIQSLVLTISQGTFSARMMDSETRR